MIIDLRSDTLTVPTNEMRRAMASAVVGDDVYSEDPTICALEERVASDFGKEAALFVPSGTQGNQICLALHAGTGSEVIADKDAHIFHYENAATSVIARAQIHGIATQNGNLNAAEVERAIRPVAYYYPQTSVIAVENTHNRHGGTVVTTETLRALGEVAAKHNIPMHCDGARIWNAMVATGTTAAEYGSYFSTLSVCFSKGLGAPVGSAIVGSRAAIEHARRWRKMLGGGMRQAGILAAAALYALDNHLPLLHNDHRRARMFAESISGLSSVRVNADGVQTNIVLFTIPGRADAEIVSACFERGLRVAPIQPGIMRAVFYHQISDEQTRTAASIVREVAG